MGQGIKTQSGIGEEGQMKAALLAEGGSWM